MIRNVPEMVAGRVTPPLGGESPVEIEPRPIDDEEEKLRGFTEGVWLHSVQEWSLLHPVQPGTLSYRAGQLYRAQLGGAEHGTHWAVDGAHK